MKNMFKSFRKIMKQVNKSMKKAFKLYDKSSIWLKIFIITALVLLLLKRYNEFNGDTRQEGFTQMKSYVIKENNNLYDDFYVKHYDEYAYTKEKTNFEFNEICYTSKPNKKTSSILDVGCGTGNLVNKFVKKGYKVKGIDKSKSMIKKAKSKHPNCNFNVENALTSINHSPNSYTHILCTYFTIYYMKNKLQFFRNAFTWLKPKGTLTLHLVNRDKFSPIVDAAEVLLMVDPQKYAKKRITQSFIKFRDYSYKADFKLQKHKNMAVFDEKFKSDKSGHVRQNQHTMYMEKQKDILAMAKSVGFILQGKIDMKGCGFKYQYLYVLKKP